MIVMGRRVYRAKNRGRNEGTISFRPCDGRWYSRLDLGVINGRRVRKCFYGATREEVANQLTLAKAERLKGESIPVGRFTVAQLLENWLATIAPPIVAARTHESYALNSRKHVIPAIGKLQVSKLDPEAIQSF